jgi:hypothetical protein
MFSNLKRRIVAASTMLCVLITAWAYNITGSVADEQGDPLIGASVRLLTVKDSTQVKAAVANNAGQFSLNGVKAGTYLLETAYIGSTTKWQRVTVKDQNITLKKIVLSESATVLREAVVSGIRTPIKVMEDTIEFNADSYKTQPNAVVEDLLKRLPGVEVSSDGKITANGKEVTKILVDGKEFFSDDPKVASKNLPVNIVDKLQVVDRKSDLARITGVEDGEEETVINLTVKKGMNNGWFGNTEWGIGTDSRYTGSFTANRFWNGNQITLLGGLNNINQPAFTDGASGRFSRFGGDNGITLSQMLGINFNVGKGEDFRVGGNVMYSGTSVNTETEQDRQYLFTDSTSYYNTNKRAHDKGHNVRADFRVQWNPDSLNTFDFRPTMSYNQNNSWSNDSSLTRSGRMEDVTRSYNNNSSKGTSWEFGAELIYNHKFRNKPGRSFSVQARVNTSNVREKSDSYSWNKFFQLNDSIDLYDQYADNHTWSTSTSARLSWTEPIGNIKNGNYLTFAYNFSYRWNNADKLTYDHPITWPNGWDGDPVIGEDLVLTDSLSNQFRNTYMTQDIRAGFKHTSKATTLDVGLSIVPQRMESKDLINSNKNITNSVVNIAPYLRYRYKVSKTRSINMFYRGRASQPSMSQLQPVADYSNPLRVVVGNPNLDPSFTHSINVRFQDFNQNAQQSIMAMVNAQVTQNSIVSRTTYNSETGGQTTTYENVNGVWNVMSGVMYSTPFRNKDFVFNTGFFGRYSHSVGFNNGVRNLTGNLSLNITPSIAWRPDNLELEIRPRYSLQNTTTSLKTTANSNIHTYGGMFNGTYYTPFGLIIATDLDWAKTSGYTAGYNTNTCLWNASLSYRFLRDQSLTLTLKTYDLLQQKQNVQRSVTANYIDDSRYNALTRYFMVTVSYRFNTFGKGNEPTDRNRPNFDGAGGPPPGGGGRPGGGPGGGGPGGPSF